MACKKQSNFYVTCNLLNKYLNEKRSFSKIAGLISMNPVPQSPDSVPRQTALNLFPELDLNKAATDEAVSGENATVGEQMTIFYDGDVLSFHNVSSENAASLIKFAMKCKNSKDSSLDMEMLPMARRTSLQRFLETRKIRINSKAPYKMNGTGSKLRNYTAKAQEEKPWLGLSLDI